MKIDKDELKETVAELEIGVQELGTMFETLVELVNDLKFIVQLTEGEDD